MPLFGIDTLKAVEIIAVISSRRQLNPRVNAKAERVQQPRMSRCICRRLGTYPAAARALQISPPISVAFCMAPELSIRVLRCLDPLFANKPEILDSEAGFDLTARLREGLAKASED
jgi:hypothetical protein